MTYKHVCIDLETFGTTPDSNIHEIALTFFNIDELGPTHSWTIDWLKQGRPLNADTVLWWMKKPRVMRERVTNQENRVLLESALQDICNLLTKEHYVWANSPRFDCEFLINALRQQNCECPWDFRKECDFRILQLISPIDRNSVPTDGHHTAAGDSKWQALMIMKSVKQLQALGLCLNL